MAKTAKAIREGILSRYDTERVKYKKKPRAVPKCGVKTPLMKALEEIHNIQIEDFIWQLSISEVCQLLNVSEFTVGYWRKKFPLDEYTTGIRGRKLPIPKSN